MNAHGWGLAWFEQKADGSFEEHPIITDKKETSAGGVVFTEPHSVSLIDVNRPAYERRR